MLYYRDEKFYFEKKEEKCIKLLIQNNTFTVYINFDIKLFRLHFILYGVSIVILLLYFTYVVIVEGAFILIFLYFTLYICCRLDYFSDLCKQIGDQNVQFTQKQILIQLIKYHQSTFR